MGQRCESRNMLTRKLKLDWVAVAQEKLDLECEFVYFEYLFNELELPLDEEYFLKWLEK